MFANGSSGEGQEGQDYLSLPLFSPVPLIISDPVQSSSEDHGVLNELRSSLPPSSLNVNANIYVANRVIAEVLDLSMRSSLNDETRCKNGCSFLLQQEFVSLRNTNSQQTAESCCFLA